ncbi:glycoside hydrolase family 36 protein [Streptomyces sp. NBC_01304]|uniref:glycoside hydrolase family 36 protein n=1 Tax=Streptomyces sp. NBC_01304 TaxID=2903818 RepID=UPI002E0D8DC5|nr:alpha-galactosidase [Streptomyces sp. NBC_01304]
MHTLIDDAPEAVTTAGLAPAPFEPLLDGVRIAVVAPDASWQLGEPHDGVRMLTVRCPGAPLEIRLSVPLGDAAGYWHPQGGWQRTLLADWAGRSEVSLVDAAAAGCLYDHTGATLLTFAAADPVREASLRFGVSEESDTHVVHLRLPASKEPHEIAFVPRAASVASALRVLRGWFAERIVPMPVPEAARTPVYSTWYAFNQNVSATEVETQATLAARLGCGVLILDDGWQELGSGRGYAGCGDWRPDRAKFPDFTAHVERVQETGLRYVAWIAPLLLGPSAACFDRLASCAPAPAGAPGAYVLDPRLPQVRAHVVELCTRLVAEHGLDGLKVDFLDEVMVYAGSPECPAGADIPDVGLAMTALLTELRAALESVRPEVLLELRQPYTGPGMAPFGNMLRSFDCPADATANRVRTLDTSLLAVGGAVHSDMLLWDRDAPVEAVARQLIGALHCVPQISVRLDELSESHLRTVEFWLRQWSAHRELLLDGEVEPGRPDELFTVVRAAAAGQALISVHSDRVVPLDLAAHQRFTLVNGSPTDRIAVEVRGGEGWTQSLVHGPDGRMIEGPLHFLHEGLQSLPVPRGGLISLTVSEGPR